MASSVLAPVQERGRAALKQLGLPNRRQEPWRLTDLKRLAAVSELPVSASPLSTSLPASLDGVTRLMLNGFDDPLAGQVLPEGITALSLPGCPGPPGLKNRVPIRSWADPVAGRRKTASCTWGPSGSARRSGRLKLAHS
ncbi:hypothetical protein N9U66_01930 [Synechococcus sp. AH-736-M20]|nr:hypothetical protein [Synechococcus sp. AH-736-M20]